MIETREILPPLRWDAAPRTTIQAIISDLGQVLLPFDTERAWSAILPYCRADEAAVRGALSSLLRETRLGCGGISGAEFHRRLAEQVGLRLSAGIRPTPQEWRRFESPIRRFVDDGLLEATADTLRLTRRGVLLSNEVFQEFINL